SVCKHSRRTIGPVSDGEPTCQRTMHQLRFGRRRQPFVHGAAFVSLEMTECEPAQPIDWDDLAHSRRYNGEHPPMPAVKKQRLFTINEELVECEAGAFRGLRQKSRYPIDTVTNLVGPDLHLAPSDDVDS